MPKVSKRTRTRKNFPKASEIATHISSIDWSGLITHLPNPDVIIRELGATNQKVYENILSDSHLASVIQQRKSGVKSMLWDVGRGQSKSREAKAVKMALQGLDVYRIINDALEAPYWGMQPLEILWEFDKSFNLIMPLEILGKPPEWFQFDSNNILRYLSRHAPVEGIPVPPRKFLLARHDVSYKNPYGNSLLSKVFWPVTFKKAGWKFWVAFAEKYGNPVIIGKVPRASDETEYQKLADILADTIQDGVIIMPDDSTVEVVKIDKQGGSAVFKDLIQFANTEISKAILSNTLTTEATDKGTQALGSVHREVSLDVINEDKRMVEDCFNTFIDWFLFINFGSTKDLPRFTLFHEEEIDLTLSERDKNLADTGQIDFQQQYVDKAYGFEPGDVIVHAKVEPTEPETEETEEFAESDFKDQQAVDALVDAFGPDELQAQAVFVKPILSLGNKADNFDEFRDGLIEIFPDVRPEDFEAKFRDQNFVSRVWGNINGAEN